MVVVGEVAPEQADTTTTNPTKTDRKRVMTRENTPNGSNRRGIAYPPPMELPRVLIADSDHAVTGLLSRALIAEGYDVEVVHDGRDALAQGEQTPYDLILLDHFLPGVLGIEVLQRWATFDLPGVVIMMSSVSDRTSVVLSLDTGAVDFIGKPFDLSVLLARVRVHFRDRKVDSDDS